MTNQQTNNEWIEKARQQYSMCMSPKRHEIHCELFKQSILSNLHKPTEVVAPVEPINQERLREIKEKYQLRLERNRKERDKTSIEGVSEILTKEFVEDLQSLQSESEVVERKGHIENVKYVEPINQERLIDYNDSGNVAKFVVDFCVKNGYSFNIHYAESCGEFELNIEDYPKTIYYNKKGGLSYYVPEALQSLQSESEVVQGEKKDWKRDYIRKIPSSEYVDWLKDNMWRLPQGPFECDRCRTERERRERGVQC